MHPLASSLATPFPRVFSAKLLVPQRASFLLVLPEPPATCWCAAPPQAEHTLRWLTCVLLGLWQPVGFIYFCQWCAPDSLVNAVADALPVMHPYLILWWALVLLYVPIGLKLMLLIPAGKLNNVDPRIMKLQSGAIGSSPWQRQVRPQLASRTHTAHTLLTRTHTRTRTTHGAARDGQVVRE